MQNNKTADFASIKQTLSKVNKCMYRTTLAYNSISLLEKSAITGRPFDSHEPKPRNKKKFIPEPWQQKLKKQHKNKEGVQIYQLPKQPFGVHLSYNEDEKFLESHFKKDSIPDDMTKGLEVLKRKFRLNDKNSNWRAKTSYGKRKNEGKEDLQFMRMEAGFLVCPVVKELVRIYDCERESYERLNEGEKVERRREEGRKKVQEEVVQRLCPSREGVESNVSRFYRSKYSALFSDIDLSTRPATGMRAKDGRSVNISK